MNLKIGLILAAVIAGAAVASIGRLRSPSAVSSPVTAAAGSAAAAPVAVTKIDNGSESVSPRLPHSATASGETRQMTIKRLGNFDYETTKKIPDDVKALDGTRVRLTGFMLINWESEHIHEFSLIPALYTCCYGEPPAVQHIVRITAPPGQTFEYVDTPITVEGILTVKEIKDDAYVTGVFKIAATKISTLPQ